MMRLAADSASDLELGRWGQGDLAFWALGHLQTVLQALNKMQKELNLKLHPCDQDLTIKTWFLTPKSGNNIDKKM